MKRSRGSPKKPAALPNAAGAPAATAGRKWLFRLASPLVPILCLLILELGLRLGGYGYSTNFFTKTRIGDGHYIINNETFSLRFFPPQLARWPVSFRFKPDKSADTVRIFVFGESAAMGDPQPAYGASRYMEVLLRQRLPGLKFEVINLGITAINSHVILPIAQECARQHGDIWIIYMGNNEMVGPFGPATVFGARAPPRFFVRLHLAVQKLRLGQLFSALAQKLKGKPANTSWGGMQMFLNSQVAPDDPRKETVYKSFEANLNDIIHAGLNSGAKIVLSTVSVNLRDCPPFASMTNSNLPPTPKEQFNNSLSAANSFLIQSNYSAAADLLSEAVKADPQNAEAHYRLAECLLRLTNSDAHEQFQMALDNDALPFRADTRINATIRQTAQSFAGERLALCDAEAILAEAGSGSVAGGESFYEHVHFCPEGNYRLGLAWAAQVEKLLPETAKGNAAAGWSPEKACDRALGLTIWNRHFLLQSVIRRMAQPPLNMQSNNAERLKVLSEEDQMLLRLQSAPDAMQAVRDEFKELIQRSPDDPFLYEGQANFLEAIGDANGAIEAYHKLNEMLPHDFYSSLQLGRLLGEQGKLEQALPLLEKATRLRPGLPEGWHERGVVLGALVRFVEALHCFENAEQIRPQDPANVCYTGKVLAKLDRRSEAIQHYRRAIQLKPDYWEARFELAGELAGDNDVVGAIREYQEVAKINPRHAVTRVNLGVLLVRLNRLDEAVSQFEEALRIEPGNRAAQGDLEQVRARLTRKQ